MGPGLIPDLAVEVQRGYSLHKSAATTAVSVAYRYHTVTRTQEQACFRSPGSINVNIAIIIIII